MQTNPEEILYSMSLLQSTEVEGKMVTRVPGGWIIDNCFVPFSSEFQPKQTKTKQTHFPVGYLGVSFKVPKKPTMKNAEGKETPVTPLRWAFVELLRLNNEYDSHKQEAIKFLSYYENKQTDGRHLYIAIMKPSSTVVKPFDLPGRWATWKLKSKEYKGQNQPAPIGNFEAKKENA